jgi:hypothetical protein
MMDVLDWTRNQVLQPGLEQDQANAWPSRYEPLQLQHSSPFSNMHMDALCRWESFVDGEIPSIPVIRDMAIFLHVST